MANDSEVKARFNLPGEWLAGVVCPVCGHTQLTIDRNPDKADQMVCQLCATSFEIAQDGELVRLCHFPATFPPELANSWVRSANIKQIAFQVQKSLEQQPKQVVVEVPLKEQAIRLAKLGNSPQKIKEILLRTTQADPKQIDEVLETANQAVKKEKKGSFVFWLLGAVILTLLVVIFIELLPGNSKGTKGNSASNNFVGGATQDDNTFDISSLPGALQTLIPKGMKVLKPAPVVVTRLDEAKQPQVKCPQSAGEAARLFGGKMENWSAGSTGGWVLISISTEKILLPRAMSAGYLVVSGSPEMTTVLGPAILENINFVAINCQ